MSGTLVQNGDFENGTQGWSFTNQGSGVASETLTNQYCNITSTESIYQQIGISEGDTFNVSLSTRGILSGTISLMLQNSNTSYWSSNFNLALNADWTTETFKFSVVSG